MTPNPRFASIPALDTPRLRLRILGADGAAACARYALRNREHHAPTSPVRGDEYFTEAFWSDRLAGSHRRFFAGESVEFKLLAHDGDDILGHCTFDKIVFGAFEACYLGYGLDVDAVGKGYMTETLAAALTFVFDTLRLHRVMANYMPSNERSAAVLRRLGFRVEGYAKDYLEIDGTWRDHILTALNADEWARRRTAT